MNHNNLAQLTDNEPISNLTALVEVEIHASAKIVLHLAEMDDRELYLELGYPSLFQYAHRKLGYSEPAANRR